MVNATKLDPPDVLATPASKSGHAASQDLSATPLIHTKESTISADRPSHLEVWVDPACPWSWQTARWLRDLRDRGVVDIEWRLFSLEVNSSPPDAPFWEGHRRYGGAHTSLMLALRDNAAAFERLYVTLGQRLHEQREEMSSDTLQAAVEDAGLGDVIERADADPTLVDDVLNEYHAARERSVFGVPTMTVNGSKPIYGPILSLAPQGDDAIEWWKHVCWMTTRPDFFELKRWPRDIKPGHGVDDPSP